MIAVGAFGTTLSSLRYGQLLFYLLF